MVRKKVLSVILSATIMFTGLGVINAEAKSSKEIKVKVDGREIYFPDAKPFIDSASRTLIPLRFVSEALGAKVAWEKLTYTVVITTDGSEPQVSNETSKTVVKNGKTYQISDKHPMLVVGVEKFDEPTFLLLEGDAGYNKYANGISVDIWGIFNDNATGYIEKIYTKEEVIEMNKRGIPSPKQLAWYLSSNPGVSDPNHIPDNEKTFDFSENFDYSGKSAYYNYIIQTKERWDNYKSERIYSSPEVFGEVVTFENDKACFNDTRYNGAPGGYIRRCLPLE